ncbi:MAG: hypothetical protein C0417_00940 [Chlorobiaceae bacterium]|nr:hypothetical protein [Chlorobiaceae bacterium]
MILKQVDKHYNPDLWRSHPSLGQVGVKKTPGKCWALAPMYFGLKSDLFLFLFIHELKLVAIHSEYEKPDKIMKKVLELEKEISKNVNEIQGILR